MLFARPLARTLTFARSGLRTRIPHLDASTFKRGLSTTALAQAQRLYYAGLLPNGQPSSHLRPAPQSLLNSIAGTTAPQASSNDGSPWLHLTHLTGGSSHALLVGHVGQATSDHMSSGSMPQGNEVVLAVGRTMLGALGKEISDPFGWNQPLRLPSTSLVRGTATGLGSSLVFVRDLIRSKNDVLYVWGNNASGQLGLSRSEYPFTVHSPVELSIPETYQPQGGQSKARLGINQVASGLDHTLILCVQVGRKHGGETQVFATGLNADGQLGRPEVKVTSDSFAPLSFPLEKGEIITSIAAGGDTSFALSSAGRVFGWGNNEYGQALGPGGEDQVRVPTDVTSRLIEAGLHHVTKVVVAGSCVAFVDHTNNIWTTGYGALGRPMDQVQGKNAVVTPLAAIPAPLGPFSKLAAGTEYFATQTESPHADPPLLVWGLDSPGGRLGLGQSTGDRLDDPPPTPVVRPRVPLKIGDWPKEVEVVDLACTIDTLYVLVDDKSEPEQAV